MDLLKLRHGASPDCATTKYVLNGLMSRSKWICWSHSASRPEAVLPVKIKPPNLAIRPMYRIRRQVTAKESHNGPSRIRARPCAARSQPRRAPADRGRQGLGRAEEAAAKERRRQNRPPARAARGGDARRAGQEAGREGVRRSAFPTSGASGGIVTQDDGPSGLRRLASTGVAGQSWGLVII